MQLVELGIQLGELGICFGEFCIWSIINARGGGEKHPGRVNGGHVSVPGVYYAYMYTC